MKIRLNRVARYSIATILILLGLILLIKLRGYYDEVRASALINQYEQILPLLAADNVKIYINKSWCKEISYQDSTAYFVDQPYSACGGTSGTSGQAGSYTPDDLNEFNKTKQIVGDNIDIVSIEYDDTGKIISASFVPSNCFWCDTSYSYSASGTLPDLTPGFFLDGQINSYWYEVKEGFP